MVTPQAGSEAVDVTIHFAGGFTSHHELRRSVARYAQMHDYPQLLHRAQELAEQKQTALRLPNN